MLGSISVFIITVILLFVTVCLAFVCINALNDAPPYIIVLEKEENPEMLIRKALDAHPLASIVIIDRCSSEVTRQTVKKLQKDYSRILFLKEVI